MHRYILVFLFVFIFITTSYGYSQAEIIDLYTPEEIDYKPGLFGYVKDSSNNFIELSSSLKTLPNFQGIKIKDTNISYNTQNYDLETKIFSKNYFLMYLDNSKKFSSDYYSFDFIFNYENSDLVLNYPFNLK